ncbi:MAG: hypothetical protein DYH17_15110 [Xanthomonadales bacterium PRO6]|nr:hypothetical protein [Xanthomonadales bacterium]MCE7932689.1 hypothetical protein [Xanthomonadales bacterium PRO6]
MNPFALLRFTLDLIQLRASPADAPRSTLLLLQLLSLDLLSSLLFLQALGTEILLAPLLGRLLLRLGMIYAVLASFRRGDRWVQTAIALFAVSVLLTFVMLPIAAALVRTPGDSVALDVQFLQLGYLSLLLWSIVIDAHVLRHALNLKIWYTLPMALGLFMLFNELATRMFPLS